MMLIKASPVAKAFNFDRGDTYFINTDEIKFAVYNEYYPNSRTEVNVTLKDDSRWVISRDDFQKQLRKGELQWPHQIILHSANLLL